jgi:hypothetical protein
MLDYSLHDNLLTERPGDMSAKAHPSGSYDREAFINVMLERGTLVTKTDIVAVLTNMEEAAASIVKNGGTINMPLFNTSFSITGVFDGPTDSFDAARHKLKVNVRKGSVFREAEQQVKMSKANTVSPQPQIMEVKDVTSGKIDSVLTSGGIIEIAGINIKLSGKKSDVGLCFVAEDGTENKAAVVAANKPSRVIAQIPVLAKGVYKVKIVTQFCGRNGKDWKEAKVATYNRSFRVE